VETIAVQNFDEHSVDVWFCLDFAASFEDMLVIRGIDPGRRGTLHGPQWDDGRLLLQYDGADGRRRTTSISFAPAPDDRAGSSPRFHLCLEPEATATIKVTVDVRDEGPGRLEVSPTPSGRPPFEHVIVRTDNPLLNNVIERSFEDLRMLLQRERGDEFFAAGLPWYAALFGRDSLIAALEMLAFDPQVAANTLDLLAAHQGTRHDPWRDEQPGKILHELRVGEKANLNEVPMTPYYGTIDATPLWVILLAEYVRWTADLRLWRRLRPNLERALQWIDQADSDGDGFIDYTCRSDKGLDNQAWKDSDNSMRNRDGSIARPPIAPVEVQGYVYRARMDAAWLYELAGEPEAAQAQRQQAEQLRRRFRQAFWVADLHYFAEALQKDGVPAAAVTSNPGQALWSGIVAEDQAGAVAARLMQEDMFSGWGIRTMASSEAAYNPLDYQVGAVWPHDTAFVAAGLQAHGFSRQALRVFSALVEAAEHFRRSRLPEVFAGFSREEFEAPVQYPVACAPQAWAAGAIPFMLSAILGLRPDATAGRLDIFQPSLPEWLHEVILEGVQVGETHLSLRFARRQDRTETEVLEQAGRLRVDVRG
jgi:glycogen debranching enzyme